MREDFGFATDAFRYFWVQVEISVAWGDLADEEEVAVYYAYVLESQKGTSFGKLLALNVQLLVDYAAMGTYGPVHFSKQYIEVRLYEGVDAYR